MNAIAWGFAIREVRDPSMSLGFLLRLAFNRWFVLAMASAFTASLLSYAVLRWMDVLAGRFFLSLGAVATIITCTLVLGGEPHVEVVGRDNINNCRCALNWEVVK
ncbi:hypothetical protein [Desulfurococcus amylolyticus]|uniref:hypothetical protein n=1 Tax=Desulfurococcus amylolyticus TaxID=94694 RepID=UPI0018DE24E3|nr:hypothetical protein [Desulfurococcus amylolyticus]